LIAHTDRLCAGRLTPDFKSIARFRKDNAINAIVGYLVRNDQVMSFD
jgi:hypothetical protein